MFYLPSIQKFRDTVCVACRRTVEISDRQADLSGYLGIRQAKVLQLGAQPRDHLGVH